MLVPASVKCQGRWPAILKSFGLTDSQLSGRHGSCPLCARHHQISGEGYVSRHGDGKARFEAEYGKEADMLARCSNMLRRF